MDALQIILRNIKRSSNGSLAAPFSFLTSLLSFVSHFTQVLYCFGMWYFGNKFVRGAIFILSVEYFEMVIGVWACMDKMWNLGILFPGNVHFWREIFAILRRNASFRCIFLSFSYIKCLKIGKIFTFLTQFVTIFHCIFSSLGYECYIAHKCRKSASGSVHNI